MIAKSPAFRWSPARRVRSAAAVALASGLFLAGQAHAEVKASTEKVPSFGYATSFSGNYLAGRMAGQLRDIESAAGYYREALAADPTSSVLIERTFPLLLADGRVADALPLAERIVQRDKGNQLARLTLGVDLVRRGQYERARAQFSQMATRPVSDLTAAMMIAWTYAGQNDPDGAIKAVDKLSGPDMYAVFRNFNAGLIAELAGRKAEALKRLAAAYKSDQNALRVTDAYARSLARNGKPLEAAGVLENFEKIIPDHPLINELKEEIAAGKQPAPLINSASAGATEFLYGLGSLLGREGGNEEAAAIYIQLGLWLDPKAELPLISLAGVHGQLRNYQKALDTLQRIPNTSRLRPMVDITIGRYYNLLSNFDQARAALESSVSKSPNDVEAIVALADVLRANKKYAEAAESYSRAIALVEKPTKNDWTLYFNRAVAYERTKQWPLAEADFFKALDLNPNEPQILNYLGYSWIDMGVNLDKGLDFVKQAVELKPDDGYIVDSLGWAYYKLGRYDDAVRELERAVLLKPEDPVINDHLGDAYWRVGRELEAGFQWRHARDLKPEPEDLARIEKKLKDGFKEEPTAPSALVEPKPTDPKPQ
jgi:tetratricopeptide (TPR) repeat protein